MTRRNSNKIIVAIIIFVVTVLFNFLKNVHRCKQWKNFFITSIPLSALLTVGYLISYKYNIAGMIVCLASLIIYSVYWYKILSIKTARLNAGLWQQRQWWWTLDGWQFEQEVANVFRINGYQAKVTKGSGDGGIDIILKKNGITTIVQCKHYKNPVPPEPIRALWGVKDDFGASEVILVASSGITEMGARFVKDKPNFKVLNLDDIIMLSQNSISDNDTTKNDYYYKNKKQENTINNDDSMYVQQKEYKTSNYGRKIDL